MTLDEEIKNMETIAEGNQLAIDTGIIFNDTPIDMFFCDNNEVKNKCLANYQRCAEEHHQLAEWLKDYKRLLDQQPCEDAISREHTLTEFKRLYFDNDTVIRCAELVLGGEPSVYPKPRTGHWISQVDLDDTHYGYICDKCNKWVRDKSYYCPNCGAKMVEPQESEDKDADKKCIYKETRCGSYKWQLDCPIEADMAEGEG